MFSTRAPFFLADPLGWDSGNWSTADDRGNWVGRPMGSAEDAGAGNGNFSLSAPAVSLPGRGIDVDLRLFYSSRLWSKAATEMTYNADAGYPAPGWSFGFGRMYYLGSTGGCILVTPDGTRRSFAGSNNVYSYGGTYHHTFTGYTTDGSLTDYSCTYDSSGGTTTLSGSASMSNGTIVDYGSNTTSFDQIFPTTITDAHGNYISISYLNNRGPELNAVQDTLGRTLTFNYEKSRLINITGPGYNGATSTFLRLDYAQQTLSYAFASGYTTSVANGSPYQLRAVYYPTTNTGYWFGDSDSYSSYGMLAKVIYQRGMTSSGTTTTQGSVTAGTMTKQDVYNYPMSATSTLTDAPTYTNLSETWEGTDNPSATACNSVNTTAAVTCYNVSTSADEVITVTRPDGSTSKQTSEISGSYDNGMWYQTEILNPSSTVIDKTKIYLQQGSYLSPRPTSIEHTDDKGQLKKTELTYGSSYNQVSVRKEYNYGPTLYREQRYTYENSPNYTYRHFFSLVKTVEDYDASGNRLTRTEYNYDQSPLVQNSGMTGHNYRYDPHTSETEPGDCLEFDHPQCTYDGEIISGYGPCLCLTWDIVSAYESSTAYRGNLTSVTTYESVNNTTLSGAMARDFTYDVAGNQRTATTDCCQQISTEYSATHQYSVPVSVTRGSSNTSSPDRVTESYAYDSNTKLPTTVTDYNGLSTGVAYDAISRPTVVTLSSGGKRTTTYDDSSLNRNDLVQKSSAEGSGTVSNSTVYMNGRGQPVKSQYQAGSSNYNATSVKYDVMGRQWKVSMPYDTGSSPSYWTESRTMRCRG